jgi:hypothetical protein
MTTYYDKHPVFPIGTRVVHHKQWHGVVISSVRHRGGGQADDVLVIKDNRPLEYGEWCHLSFLQLEQPPKFPIGSRVRHNCAGLGTVTGLPIKIIHVTEMCLPVAFDDPRYDGTNGWFVSRFELLPQPPTRGCDPTQADHAYNAIKPQAERDDWWTQRIDPYDDRIRALETKIYDLEKRLSNTEHTGVKVWVSDGHQWHQTAGPKE